MISMPPAIVVALAVPPLSTDCAPDPVTVSPAATPYTTSVPPETELPLANPPISTNTRPLDIRPPTSRRARSYELVTAGDGRVGRRRAGDDALYPAAIDDRADGGPAAHDGLQPGGDDHAAGKAENLLLAAEDHGAEVAANDVFQAPADRCAAGDAAR